MYLRTSVLSPKVINVLVKLLTYAQLNFEKCAIRIYYLKKRMLFSEGHKWNVKHDIWSNITLNVWTSLCKYEETYTKSAHYLCGLELVCCFPKVIQQVVIHTQDHQQKVSITYVCKIKVQKVCSFLMAINNTLNLNQ